MVSDLMVVFDCLDGLQMRGSIRWQELHVLAESRKQEYGYYNINLLGSRLAPFLPKWGKQRAQVGQARYPTWASTVPKIRTDTVFLSTQNNPTAPLPPGFPFKSSKYR